MTPKRFQTAIVIGLCLLWAWVPVRSLAQEVAFSPSERALILSHGPWPLETAADPSNRFSGQAEAVKFGKSLFSDPRLSRDDDVSCQSCHIAELSFTDGLARSEGMARVDRNSLSLANLRLNRWFGWDGKSDTLWAQSIHPILDGKEMGATAGMIAVRVAEYPDLEKSYRALTGHSASEGPADTVLVNVGKFLAAYQETLVTPRTKFDAFRDALEIGDDSGINAYPQAAKRGLKLFAGRGNCSVCHFGPNFTNKEFHSVGLGHFTDNKRVDTGRYGGLKAFQGSRLNRLGPFSDEDQASATRAPTNFAAFTHTDWGAYRVPSLRNAAATGPYMHNGSLETLEGVVRHYSDLNLDRLHADGETLLKPLNLSEDEISDLVAFLETLSGAPAEMSVQGQ